AMGRIHDLSRWGSRLAPFSNWVARSAPLRWLNERVLGIDRRRKPPAWSRETFASACARRGLGSAPAAETDALLFNDTFTNYYHPRVGTAGADVLAAMGLRVALASNVCCGRPLISQGLLEAARGQAAINTDRLYQFAARRTPLVFFEPSCLSAVREDAPALLDGEMRQKARLVAEQTVLFEELVERR